MSLATLNATNTSTSLYRYQLNYTYWWIAGGFALVALVVYGSLGSGGPVMPVRNIDKLIHMSAYASLMIWFGGIYKRRAQWLILFLLFGLGVMLEFLQGMGGHRVFEIADMAMNGLGVLLGKKLSRFGLEGWCRVAERIINRIVN